MSRTTHVIKADTPHYAVPKFKPVPAGKTPPGGFGQLFTLLVEYGHWQSMTDIARNTYGVLAAYGRMRDGYETQMSNAELVRYTGLSLRSVQRATDELISLGCIDTPVEGGSPKHGKREKTVYRILCPVERPVDAIIDAVADVRPVTGVPRDTGTGVRPDTGRGLTGVPLDTSTGVQPDMGTGVPLDRDRCQAGHPYYIQSIPKEIQSSSKEAAAAILEELVNIDGLDQDWAFEMANRPDITLTYVRQMVERFHVEGHKHGWLKKALQAKNWLPFEPVKCPRGESEERSRRRNIKPCELSQIEQEIATIPYAEWRIIGDKLASEWPDMAEWWKANPSKSNLTFGMKILKRWKERKHS